VGAVVDTSVLVELERGASATSLPDGELFIAAHTLMELRVGVEYAEGARRARRHAFLHEVVLARYTCLAAGREVALIAGWLFHHLESCGRRIGYSDTWIAAAALAHREPVVTCNVAHFSRVPMLGVLPFP
jgi:predicted nucleic acid-binding protein